MRILVFTPPPPTSRDEIRSWDDLWGYYLISELKKLGVEVVIVDSMLNSSLSRAELIAYHETLDISGFDHILGLFIRYWTQLPVECGEALRRRLGRYQCLAQIHDSTLLDKPPADVTFALRDRSSEFPPHSANRRHERYHQHTCHVGWAADAELCRPQQPKDELRILVDHPSYTYTSIDYTLSTLMNLRALVTRRELWAHRYRTVSIRQLVEGAVVDVDATEGLSVKPYNRVGIPYVDACGEYSRSHMFMVTHTESVGITVIEAATAGALVIAPEGCIASDRLATVRHHEWSRFIRWDRVLPQIDVAASREQALPQSWTRMAKRIVNYLAQFDRARVGFPLYPEDAAAESL